MKQIMICLLMASLICCSTAMARRPAGIEIKKAKSPGKANLISLIGTVAPIGIAMSTTDRGLFCGGIGSGGILLLAGTIVGPGLGHSYAGNEGRLWKGIGIRTGALIAIGIGFSMSFSLFEETNSSGGAALCAVGSILLFGSSIYDIVTADDSARQYNEENGLAAKSKISFGPTYFAQHQAPGATLILTF